MFDVFNTNNANAAAGAQTAGIQQGYGQLSDLFNQGRSALNTNYAAALQPMTANVNTANQGTTALGNALGLNGAQGSKDATAAFWANPAIQSQLDIGSQNVMRNQAATGQLNSGKTNVDLQNLGQQVASQGWNNYVSQLQPYLNFSSNAASGVAGVNTGLGNQLNQSYNNQGNAAYGAQTSIGNANANAALAGNNASANMLNAGLGGASALFSMFSDERLKEDVEPVGELYDGQPVFRYRYKGDPRTQIGLIAQDVEKTNPRAVTDRDDLGGAKMVDYRAATDRAATIPGYADGGRPAVGQPSIVGEDGPEMFIPDQPGTVVPNYASRLTRMAGGDQPIVVEPSFRRIPASHSPYDPSRDLRAIADTVAPNLTDYAMNRDPRPARDLPASGKIGSGDDPRFGPALADAMNLMLTPALAIAPELSAVRAAPSALNYAARLRSLLPEADASTFASLAGTSTMMPSEASAAPRLTREQQQQLEVERQRMDAQATSERRRGLDAAETARLAEENRLHLDLERQDRETKLQREHEAQAAARPFRDRFPATSQYLSAAGMAGAALVPYGIRAWKQGQTNALYRAWEDTAQRAEKAFSAGDMPQAKMLAGQLAAYGKQASKASPKGAGALSYGVASTLPMEASMIPEEIDLMSGSPEAKQRAIESFTDPVRVPAALVQGATFAGLGGKLPVPTRTSPEARSAGIVKAVRASRPPKRRAAAEAQERAQ